MEKVVGLLIERTGKDFQQGQRLRADVEKRLREMGVKEVETRSDTEDSTLGPTSVTKKRGRRLKYKELYALHDEMMKANSDATDEMIINAYNQKYSRKKHKKTPTVRTLRNYRQGQKIASAKSQNDDPD